MMTADCNTLSIIANQILYTSYIPSDHMYYFRIYKQLKN